MSVKKSHLRATTLFLWFCMLGFFVNAQSFEITSPQDNSTHSAGTITLQGQDNSGDIKEVIYYINGVVINNGTEERPAPEDVKKKSGGFPPMPVTEAPFALDVELFGGRYNIRARAEYNNGDRVNSRITITVTPETSENEVYAVRLSNRPIISHQNFIDIGETIENDNNEEQGSNINGPDLHRIPDWIPRDKRADPRANYYCYFASHHGDYIPMAWSENVTGPYYLYNQPSWDATLATRNKRGVLAMQYDQNVEEGKPREYSDLYEIGNDLGLHSHIASPDVHFDEATKSVIMYFHGKVWYNGSDYNNQMTLVAVDDNDFGLNFNDGVKPYLLGANYFNVWEYKDVLFAFDNSGKINWTIDTDEPWNPDWNDGWTGFEDSVWDAKGGVRPLEGHDNQAGEVRHIKNLVEEDKLHCVFSQVKDTPERIYYSVIDMSTGNIEPDPDELGKKGTYLEWEEDGSTTAPKLIMTAEYGWEGGQFVKSEADGGGMEPDMHALRDPDIFQDADGRIYMVYCGQGEDAIGIAELFNVTQNQGNLSVSNNYNNSKKLSVYPNPATEFITVRPTNEFGDIKLTDLLGKLIINQSYNTQEVILDVSTLKSGIYLLEVDNSIQKVIIGK